MPTYEEFEKEKMRGIDKILVLEKIEGESTKDDAGRTDNRLFLGEGQNVHAIREDQTGLWTLKLEKGGLPESLKQKFTTFRALKQFAEHYYRGRGLKITDVKEWA